MGGLGLFYLGFRTGISPFYQEITVNSVQKGAILRLVPAYSPKHVTLTTFITAEQELTLGTGISGIPQGVTGCNTVGIPRV